MSWWDAPNMHPGSASNKKYFIFSCDQAAPQMVFSVRLSVCPSVRLSVRLSHLFDYVPIIVSSWNFQELLPMTDVRSMQKVKVRGQRSRSQSVKSTSSTSSSTSPYLEYSGGVSLYAWCRYSWVFMLLKCGAGVTTRQVWSESSHGVTRPMISKNWTDFILKWTGLYTLELTTHWPQSWLCGNTLVVMTHTKFPLSPFDQEYNLIKPGPVCITHQ